ncbi:hypothetical protein HN371_15365 [Candidatus Poribacteria bacterium]|jgi:hypothetical protein|nr:hypothetical protein [Candidatus Poribacteria bacterium]MBT5710114.1 hypothetical protein [Candidatus Poribacteria bacterium]MBT7803935.1 hypothetical protein [Candidatus Poribacteria bacterium]
MQKDKPDETVVGTPTTGRDRYARPVELVRDPRDYRELLTDVLGITTDASTLDVMEDSEAAGQTNLLGRRKRDKAWREIQDPANRLVEEAFLYPMAPVPTPSDDGFPYYDAQLPETPTLHRTEDALQRLIETVAAAIPTDVANSDATLRISGEPAMPDLPDPDFSAAPTPAPEPVPAPVDSSSATVEPATDAVDAAADADPPLDIDEMLPEDADPA